MRIASLLMPASYCYLIVEAHTYKLPREDASRVDTPARPGGLKSSLVAALGEPGHRERLAHMKETPGRAEALDRIVAAGSLEADDAAALFPDRRITDDA